MQQEPVRRAPSGIVWLQDGDRRLIEIVLTKTREFNDLSQDIVAFYKSFVLPSWIPEHYGVEIYDKVPVTDTLYAYNASIQVHPSDDRRRSFRFVEVSREQYEGEGRRVDIGARVTSEQNKVIGLLENGEKKIEDEYSEQRRLLQDHYLNQRPLPQENGEYLEQYKENESHAEHFRNSGTLIVTAETPSFIKGKIEYRIESGSEVYAVQVRFLTVGPNFILIDIDDPTKFFQLLQPVDQSNRLPTIWIRRDGELYYPYIEPAQVRTKVMDKPHFSLAFQGGGAKGAAYIGAVQALKDMSPGVEVKSIIGSSAGGIIALALAAGCPSDELVNHCKQMATIPKDTTVVTRAEIDVNQINRIIESLRKALVNYGVLPEGALYIVDGLFNERGIEAILKVVSTLMDGIGEMFDLTENGSTKKINYYGLLLARLLKGEAVQSIALDIIQNYLKKENRTSTREKATSLTMKEFYDMTGVEFTVTSVDINSQILRFFNHKTTPDLPVHKAVIMTGSFPVAFEALKWRKEWGKYYIHYENWRREIDLEGHQFTDGGMLANFPMMFFDNESMRPMYFAHKSNENTRVAGFGLEEIPDKAEGEALSKKRDALVAEMAATLKSNLPWGYRTRIIKNFGLADNPRELRPEEYIDPATIPLLDFIVKLIKTYISASDNLVYEWFENDMTIESPYKTIGQMLLKPIEPNAEQLKSVSDITKEMSNDRDVNNKLRANIAFIKKQIYRINNAEKYLAGFFTQYKSYIRNTLVALVGIKEKKLHRLEHGSDRWLEDAANDHKKNPYENLVNELLLTIEKGKKEMEAIENCACFEPVVRSYQPSDSIAQLGLSCFFILKNFPEVKLRDPENAVVAESFEKELAFWFRSPVRSLLSDLNTRLWNQALLLRKYGSAEKLMFEQSESNIRTYINKKLRKSKSQNLHLVFQGSGEHNMYSYEVFKLVEDCIFKKKYSKDYQLEKKAAEDIVKLKFSEEPMKTQYIFRMSLTQILTLKLDKVLAAQAIDLGHQHIEIVKGDQVQAILLALKANIDKQKVLPREQDFKITSVTCSSMHSYLAFLLTTDLKPQEIELELETLKNEFSIDMKGLVAEYEKKQWCVPMKCRINKDFQDVLWEERKDLFGQLESELKGVNATNAEMKLIQQKLKTAREEFDDSKEIILESYDDVLERLLENSDERNPVNLLEQVGKEMGLNFGKPNYYEENKEVSKQTQGFMNTLLEYFEEQIKFLMVLTATEAERELVAHDLSEKEQKEAWKCMIISRFLACNKLKRRIQNILAKLSLPKDISLQTYYRNAPRKLELTFPAVDIRNKIMRFINYQTFPAMPLWAAILIGCSLPMVFPTVNIQSYWCESIISNSSTRLIKTFFDDEKVNHVPVFVAGNLISSFPLDLLTNHKVQQKFFPLKNDYTFLNFGVNNNKKLELADERPFAQKFVRKYLTVSQIIALSMFKSFPKKELSTKISVRTNIMSTYVDAHDNLVLDLYNKELLRLPVRVSTLSFSKFSPLSDGSENPALLNMLDETYFCTKEKFQQSGRVCVVENDMEVNVDCRAPLKTYIEFKVTKPPQAPQPERGFFDRLTGRNAVQENNPWNPPKTLQLSFLSKERNNHDFTTKYKVEYAFNNTGRWETPGEDGIALPSREEKVFIRIQEPTKSRYGRDGKDVAYKIQEAIFELKLEGIIDGPENAQPIYAMTYNKTALTKLEQEKRLSETLGLRRPVIQAPPLSCKSIVDLEKTGLYCNVCCKSLKHVQQMGRTIPLNCHKCQKEKIIVFQCQDHSEVGAGKDHGRYCLDCCKNFAITRQEHNLYCELGHPYIPQNVMVLPATQRLKVICDLCQAYVEIFFMDSDCNLSICTKCCAEFSVTRVI